ncbi:hypothetical protein TNCV_3045071 [Trichonephila clavipes]|nr:hypothetical protein TNCV_3045071 [Trichonephila clavipes]
MFDVPFLKNYYSQGHERATQKKPGGPHVEYRWPGLLDCRIMPWSIKELNSDFDAFILSSGSRLGQLNTGVTVTSGMLHRYQI